MDFHLPGILVLSDDDVRSAFDWSAAITALRQSYSGGVSSTRFPDRSMARGEGVWLRTLSGVPASAPLMGAKLISASIRGRSASYLIPLFEQETSRLVALLDGASITGFRTAATSALAIDCLAPPAALDVAVIGSGFEARMHVRALAALRPLKQVRVFSPRPDSRQSFRDALADLSCLIEPVESAEAALAGASVVVCAARSRDESPTLQGAWLSSGMNIVSIGSTLPEQREVDAATIARADLIVADMPGEVAHDTGDLMAATAAGVAFTGKLVPLADVVGGIHPGRAKPDDIVLYKSVGAGQQDLAVAMTCLERASQLGLGVRIDQLVAPVDKGK